MKEKCLENFELCEDCGGLFKKPSLQEVENIVYDKTYTNYYCVNHKKDYSRKKHISPLIGDIFYKEFAVNKNGEPIGYTKNKQ